jgi:hypothetical protein
VNSIVQPHAPLPSDHDLHRADCRHCKRRRASRSRTIVSSTAPTVRSHIPFLYGLDCAGLLRRPGSPTHRRPVSNRHVDISQWSGRITAPLRGVCAANQAAVTIRRGIRQQTRRKIDSPPAVPTVRLAPRPYLVWRSTLGADTVLLALSTMETPTLDGGHSRPTTRSQSKGSRPSPASTMY